jgi:uncharacterized protein YukE
MASLAEDINSLLDDLSSRVNSLDGLWQGATQQAYVEEINDLVPLVKGDLDRVIVQAPDGLSPKLTSIANTFEEIDRTLGGK